jgi:hypothetical protein
VRSSARWRKSRDPEDAAVVSQEWSGELGEKGNLLDMGEEIFANLAEQGPQFWFNYEQYKLARATSTQARAVVEQRAGAQDPATQRPNHRAPE